MQGRADVTSFIHAFSGSNRHVLSYLVEEVLNRRPEGTLDFLLQTSLLEQLTAPLCNAVTGRSDSQTLLAKLEQANLFLISLDDEGKWYRYHHLFAEVLHTRLQQSQPALIPQLHQRASEWYAAAGQVEQAVGHALAMPDVDRAAALVERMALATVVQQGEIQLVRRLVERLPLAVVYGRPNLTLAYGFTLALSGQFDAVDALLLQAAPTAHTLTLSGEVAGGLAVLHSTLARFRGDLAQSLAFAQQALHLLPVDALALRAGAALNMGSVYFHWGDRLTAGQALTDALTWGSAAGADYIVLVAWEELATDQARQGQLVLAKQSCEQALAGVTRWNNQRVPAVGLLQVTLGEVLVEWNELEQATWVLTQGVQLLLGTTEMGLLARGYGALARSQWASGERATALTTLHQGETWLAQIQTAAPGTYARLAAQQARFQVWQGDLAAALRWEQTIHLQGETLVNYLQQLTRVRIRLAQYAREPQASFLQEANTILAPLLASAEVNGWGSHIIEILLLQALIEQAQGNRSAAQTTLTRALTLTEPEGYFRLFVDEGEAMQFLLTQWAQSAIVDFGFWHPEGSRQQLHTKQNAKLLSYVNKLLASFGNEQSTEDASLLVNQSKIVNLKSRPQGPRQNLVEPLSARELEVLQLVAAGFSNTEIATRLIVTTSTVKAHINHIFGKLAVESRTQAVARAREHGLLND
jgi:LuxR family maltose regulon positive regulatory protein